MSQPVKFQSQWADSARKRAREDDEYNSSSVGFTEHRNVSPPRISGILKIPKVSKVPPVPPELIMFLEDLV